MKKIVFLPYDFDTAIGINNEGSLTFSYNLEDIDTIEGGADVYNGQQSVLWVNMRSAFYDDIKEMYQQLRSDGELSYEVVERMFEEHQSKWPEAIFNEDAYFKYIRPLIDDGSGVYLPMLQGSKSEQRKWWLYNRFRYLDSKYNAGDALTDVIQIRGYAKDNITVTPYADVYPSIKYGSYLVQTRGQRNVPTTLICPLDNVNDTEIYIYSASQLSSVGDLSGFKVGFADFHLATRLQNIKLGDSSSSYTNTNLTSLTLGNNTLLQTIDVRNCPNLTQSIDISGCTNIEEIYFDGTGITGITLPNGGVLRVIHLPSTVANLTIRNQPSITDFTMPDYSGITTLRLENVSSAVPIVTILNTIASGSRVRIVGLNLTMADMDEVNDFISLLDTMKGIDENGNNVETAQVICRISGLDYCTQLFIDNIRAKYQGITIISEFVAQTLTITEKGQYIAEAGAGYNPVIVNLPFYSTTFDDIANKFVSGDITITEGTVVDHAFYGDTGVESIEFTAPVAVINNYSFANCTALETITANRLNISGDYAFYGCSSLRKVEISGTINIGNYCFQGCTSLSEIDTTKFTGALSASGLRGTAISGIYSSNVTSVGMYVSDAISECPNLVYARLPNAGGITRQNTFRNCPNLKLVDIRCSEITVGGIFTNDAALEVLILRNTSVVKQTSGNNNFVGVGLENPVKVYVPSSLIPSYETATVWSSLIASNQIEFLALEGSSYEQKDYIYEGVSNTD